jgi:chorismate mutase / prephenate dehydrogenase
MEDNHSKQAGAFGADKKTEKDFDQQLEALRCRIDRIDRQIVSLLTDRREEVEQVVSLKRAHNLPVYHPAREENLISDRRRQGVDAGFDADFIEELYRLILRNSRMEHVAKLAVQPIRSDAVVLIVGGRGSMGQYFRQWFSDAGYRVRILDRNDWNAVDQLTDGVDLAIVGVPIENTGQVVERLGPHLPPDCILADITSIKTPPVQAMLRAHPGPVVGLHPLFGPTTTSMDKQIIVVTPGRGDDACQWFIDQLTTWGGVIVKASPEEHDDIMGVVQTLRHFATFAFGQFLARRRIDLHRTLEFSSPIYRLELGMVGRLFSQDPALYSEIILASPERRELLKDYMASLNDNLDMIEKGDKAVFCKEFKKISEWFGSFSEQAMRESTYLIDKIIERF